jgi:hypothetical protein
MLLNSFGTKSDDWIDARCPPRGQPAGDRNCGGKNCTAAEPCELIRRGHLGPLILDETKNSPGHECAGSKSDSEQTRTLLSDELNDLRRGRTKCAANSEFAFASRNL